MFEMQGDDPNSNSEGSRIMSKKLKHENKGILLICNIRMMIKNYAFTSSNIV